MSRYFPIGLLCLLLAAPHLLAQTFLPPVVITSNDGLSQNAIHDMLQNRQGFLWFATDDGLNRYDGYTFTVYRNNPRNQHSLSCNTIECLYEDHAGNLWIGTERGGLNKFDPVSEVFSVFINDPKNPQSISSNLVTAIVQDKSGEFWIGTDQGLDKFDPVSGVFTSVDFSAGQPDSSSRKYITAMIRDSSGMIRIGTRDGSLFQYDPSRNTSVRCTLQAPGDKNESHTKISSIFEDQPGRFWVGTIGDALYLFDQRRGTVEHFTPQSDMRSLYTPYVESIRRCTDTSCLILTNRSLEILDLRSHAIRTIWTNRIFTSLHALLLDAGGVVWVGSIGTGIGKFVPQRKQFKTVRQKDSTTTGLSFSSVRAMYQDSEGNLWVGGHIGLNLLRPEKRTSPDDYRDAGWETVKPLAGENIFSIIEDPIERQMLWIGSEGGGIFTYHRRTGKLFHYSNTPGSSHPFYAGTMGYKCFIAGNGDLYMGSNAGLNKLNRASMSFDVFRHNPDDPSSIGPGSVKAIEQDAGGRLWIGTDVGGISILDPATGHFDHFRAEPGNTKNLSDDKVNAILRDSHGTMWIGTAGGLNKYLAQENRFVAFTMENGLPNDYIYAVMDDKNGDLWMSTNKGLSKFDPKTERFTNYDQHDGLQGDEFNTLAYFKSKNGELYFGGIHGFTSFHPDEIRLNEVAPRVVITGFKIFDQPAAMPTSLPFARSISLSNTNYVFSFSFAALEFTEPMKNRYAYIMDGFDKTWRTTTADQRQATYTNLDPGEYVFKVKASNNDGIWNEAGTSLRVTIVPSWWQTIWFRILGSLVVIGTGAGMYRSRMNAFRRQRAVKEKFAHQLIESQESERKRIASEMHDAVGQDLLIIKNLSFMAMESPEGEQKDRYLNDISETASRTIEDVRKISHNLRPYQIDKLGLTKALESLVDNISRTTSIRFTYDIENIDGEFVKSQEIHIYRMLQECINNVIKHSEAGESIVTVRKMVETIVIAVNDDGVGIAEGANINAEGTSDGFGLRGLTERAMILGGRIEIISKPGRGTAVNIHLPLHSTDHE